MQATAVLKPCTACFRPGPAAQPPARAGRALAGRKPASRSKAAGRSAGAGRAQRDSRRRSRLAAVQWDPAIEALTAERSLLINKEVVLFLFQLEMDSQLQRALTYENFDAAREVRARRQQVDSALRELQEIKGPGCGARVAGRSDAVEYAPQIMTLKAQMAEAAAAEKYDEAAALRDRLREVEAAAAEAADAAAQYLCPVEEPKFALGEMILHSSKGYRGVVCGWDLACCESEEWQAAAGVSSLQLGMDQVFYHVLVDARDWPPGGDHPPVAYVAEELLTGGSSVDFAAEAPLDGSFEHPYSYLLFLGADGQGNMVPCRQLRDKYCVERRDVYSAGESRWEEEDDEEGEDGDGGNGRGPGSGDDSPAGQRRIPGIDMSSLD
ncbi:hypothetical protein COHA_007942 [Chlorella ohadii]|uniref:UVR domain-containing protein n=1 Tax=Chlorella ohadii TaxID=2649997 RepID=A0AAD5DL43_9CHLO|nr:hypothetical protein COHA_007942 [Chlorella ohadii]